MALWNAHERIVLPTHIGREDALASLAKATTNALQLFADLSLISSSDQDFDIERQHERLALWAANLGATHLGHSSLDYRLREADSIRLVIASFLHDLCESLLECREVLLYGDLTSMDDDFASRENRRQNSHHDLGRAHHDAIEDEYGPNSDDVADQDLSLALQSVTETIDCLYKVATRIRNPATRLLTKRVLEFRLEDPTTGDDMTQIFAEIDKEHLRELFTCYRSEPLPEQTDSHGTSPQDLENARQVPLTPLALRLAQANTIRRKQFAYWRRHRKKLDRIPQTRVEVVSLRNAQESRASLPPAPVTASIADTHSVIYSLPTTATTLDPNKIDLGDTKSIVTVSDFAESVRSYASTARETVDLPDPPARFDGRNYFECPYCWTLCSGAYLERRAWRTHLLRDLRPYVCTYPECPEASKLFDTRQEWIAHEDTSHRRIWRCLEHPELTFLSSSHYKQHIEDIHLLDSKTIQMVDLIRLGESVPDSADRPCPICLVRISTSKELQNHVASHLIRIALFSLPRSTEADNDADSATSWSGNVAGHRTDSSGSTESVEVNLASPLEDDESETLAEESTPANLSRDALRHLQATNQERQYEEKVSDFLSTTQSREEPDRPLQNPGLPVTRALYGLDEANEAAVFQTPKPAEKRSQPRASEGDASGVTLPRPLSNTIDDVDDANDLDDDDIYACRGCGEIFEGGKAYELAGHRWHLGCFKCDTCGELMDSDANLLLLNDGALICSNCTYHCAACGKQIEELAILTGEEAYCQSCFKCRNCKQKIENLRYARTVQGIFCMDCHETLVRRRRKKKTKPLATVAKEETEPEASGEIATTPEQRDSDPIPGRTAMTEEELVARSAVATALKQGHNAPLTRRTSYDKDISQGRRTKGLRGFMRNLLRNDDDAGSERS